MVAGMVDQSYAVVDATAGITEKRFRGIAARYVEWEISRLGGKLVSPNEANILLITSVSPQQWEVVPRAIAGLGFPKIKEKRRAFHPRVILGGQAAMSPAIFDPYVDACCVGEGRNFITALVTEGLDAALSLKNAWIPGDVREVIPDEEFPWDAPPIKAEDGIIRIFASRSCQKKCLFCQTGWQTEYVENDEDFLTRQHKALIAAGYKVNVVTNDAPALSFFGEMGTMEHFSASYSQVKEIIKTGVAPLVGKVKSFRIGVEAPSQRLRKWIGKPIETESLYRASVDLLNAGIGVRWFMIAGIPGEVDEDYDELRDVVRRARYDIKKGALQLSFTAFGPTPAAPLGIAPIDDDYWPRFQRFNAFAVGGIGATHRVQVFRCSGPETRMKEAMGSMAATVADIRRGWLDRDPPNWRVRYPLRHKLRRAYNVYARKTGLPESKID